MAQPKCLVKNELNDLVCNVGLSKELAELLISMVSRKHVLNLGTNFPFYCQRDKELRQYFQIDGIFVACIDM